MASAGAAESIDSLEVEEYIFAEPFPVLCDSCDAPLTLGLAAKRMADKVGGDLIRLSPENLVHSLGVIYENGELVSGF